MRRAAFAVGLFLALFLVLAFLTLPIVAIFVHTSPGDLIRSLGEQDARDALWLSLKTSLAALGDHRDRGNARRLPARHAGVPRPRRWW